MSKHSHSFVENYNNLPMFGLDRQRDEEAVVYYLQKFSDDNLMKRLTPRMTDEELNEIFSLIDRVLKKRLTHSEYHQLFLKD